VIAVRCPHCRHAWATPPSAGPVACPVCGQAVVTPAAAVETGASSPPPSGDPSAGGCAPASVGERHPFLSPPQGPDEVGRLGRYRVLRELGAGGMGVVFEAEDTRLDRRVALKVMRVEAAAHKDGRARFQREARAAAALDHEHIVTVFEFGEENGAPFLVMPLLRGESLDARLKRQKPLPLAEALRIAAEMAEGLAAAHEARLVHRDVKPGNVWLTSPGGQVKLLDFGLARLAEGDGGTTRSGAVLGTPAYMSPEQAAGGKNVDARADLFSLGAVLYEMLTGRRAFRGDGWMEVLANRLTTRPPAPRLVNATVPEEVSDLVMRLLAEEPAGRPSSARQVAGQLGALAAPPAGSPHAPESGRSARSSGGQDGRAPGGGRWWPVAAVGALLLLPLAWWLWSRQPPAPEQPTPETAAGERPGPQLEGSAAGVTKKPDGLDSRWAALPAEKVREAQQAWARCLGAPVETKFDLGDGIELELVLVPPGRFLMGAPETEKYSLDNEFQHEVELTRAFYAGRFTVTQEQYEMVMKRNPSRFQKGKSDDERLAGVAAKDLPRLPVENVTWYDAVAFCNELSKKRGLRPAYDLTVSKRGSDQRITEATVKTIDGADGFRLPTEAEWELACRAGTRTPFHFGDRLNGDKANCEGNHPYGTDVTGTYLLRTQPVGSYEANALGLFDMHGNVWQWCQDWYGKDYSKAEESSRDPKGRWCLVSVERLVG
jgi:formylglycine-generating enzyme required for sulfatase activity